MGMRGTNPNNQTAHAGHLALEHSTRVGTKTTPALLGFIEASF